MKLNYLNWSTLVLVSGTALSASNGCDPNQQIIGDSPSEGGSYAATGGASSVPSQGGATATGGVAFTGGALGLGGVGTGGASTASTCTYQGNTYPVGAAVGLCLCLSDGSIGHCLGALPEGGSGGALTIGGASGASQGGAMATGGASLSTLGGVGTGGASNAITCTDQGKTYPVGARVGVCTCLDDGSIGHCLGMLEEGGSSSVGSGGAGGSGGVAGNGAAAAGVAGVDGNDPHVRSCLDSGGVVVAAECCNNPNVTDFTNTCTTGPCGCAPEYSKRIYTCRCPDTQCFDGSTCVPWSSR